ncbi:MAG: gamma carbonic anhydrase family protein [Desulfococcaceae bacterium]
MIYEYKGKRPEIGKNVFIAPGAVLIGDVQVGDNASVWYNTVVRADSAPIRIGRNSNVQDNCTLHVDEGKPCIIGENVTIGHNAVVHGCIVEDHCLIGIHSTTLSGAVIRRGSIVGSNAVVAENKEIGPFHLVVGVPARLKKEFDEGIIEVIQVPADIYLKKSAEFRELKRVDR